ncbi:membrane associated protein [Mycobacterium xenopi 3993]|nr:membrane associated protein [Mycobacterium xenopi 3993]
MPSLLRALLSEHLDPGYAAAAAERARASTPPTRRARVLARVWQAAAALLVAVVFAAAVAQARMVAPASARPSRCWRPVCAQRRHPPVSSPRAATRLPPKSTTCSGAHWSPTRKGSGCLVASTSWSRHRPAPRSSVPV